MHKQQNLCSAPILLISDGSQEDGELGATLSAQGCVVSRAGPGLLLGTDERCEVVVISARRSTGWSAGVITALRSSEQACASLAVLTASEPGEVARVLRCGAVDCLVRPVSTEELLESLRHAVACTRRWRARVGTGQGKTLAREPTPTSSTKPGGGERIDDPEARIDQVVRELAGPKQLTPREREVLCWLLRGHRYADIAVALGVAPRTAKFHAANLLRKLDLDSRYELPRLLAGEP